MQPYAFLLPQISSQLSKHMNPSGKVTTGMLAGAMAISGLVQGGVIGAIMSETPWYDGLWKGALAGAAASGVLGVILGAACSDGCSYTADGNRTTCMTWGDIGQNMLAIGILSAVNGLAAGAAVGAGHRGESAGKAALWAAGAFAVLNGAIDATYKVAPRSANACLPAAA
jgi:hypothetical protein